MTDKKKDIQSKSTVSSQNYILWFCKNALCAAFIGFIIFKCVNMQQGYNWAYNSLLKGNMEIIKQYPKLPIEKKFEMKLGMSYTYLNFLKNQTPENAVILFPTAEEFFPKDKKTPFSGEPFNKVWASRFLYPRKLVYQSELETNRYGKEITHVAIVNGLGFDKLDYVPSEKFEHGVLPINPNQK